MPQPTVLPTTESQTIKTMRYPEQGTTTLKTDTRLMERLLSNGLNHTQRQLILQNLEAYLLHHLDNQTVINSLVLHLVQQQHRQLLHQGPQVINIQLGPRLLDLHQNHPKLFLQAKKFRLVHLVLFQH